ncbi:MAG TPA: hypothetical protein VIX12_09950 [Candidatus Binataceae bacterium]
MLEPTVERNRAARIAMWSIIAINALLLLVSITDYRVSIDSGYHISLARWYVEHGTAWWDHINFGPGGRPNLQGPALHVAIAFLGRFLALFLGDNGDTYILANAILAIVQWLAAIGTAAYFARKLSGDAAALFAVALLAGSAYASGSFYVGIPSGWLFICVPWAIYFFMQERLAATTVILAVGCYVHLGGFVTAPVGVAIAALLQRRWRALIKVAVATAILTAPYSIHYVMNLSWYRGRHGHEALRADPLIDILAITGAVWIFRRWREHIFLLAWAAAPISWLIQDPNRFVAQSTLAGSVIAGIFLAEMMRRIAAPRARTAFAAALVALATIFPLGIPNLAAEAAWDAGLHFPRLLDWDEARALAAVIQNNHLNNYLLSCYATSFGPSIAVFTPVTLQRGHWVEVQPLHDPAEDLSAGTKVYVIPLAPDDPALHESGEMGLVRVYGGTSDSAVITLPHAGDPSIVRQFMTGMMRENAAWLGEHAVNNKMPPIGELVRMATPQALETHRALMAQQRFHAGRMELACLLYAYSMESKSPDTARGVRNAAMGFGSIASFLSDGDPVGFVDDARHEQFRKNMTAFAAALQQTGSNPAASAEARAAEQKLFADYFGNAA